MPWRKRTLERATPRRKTKRETRRRVGREGKRERGSRVGTRIRWRMRFAEPIGGTGFRTCFAPYMHAGSSIMDGRAVRRPCLSSLFFHGGRGSPRNNPQTRLEFDLPVSLEGSLSRTRLCLVETGQWWGKEGKDGFSGSVVFWSRQG